MDKKDRKQAGKHDWSGSCYPKDGNGWNHTFSVGIFKWLPKSTRKGLKRSAVIYRVRGYTEDPKSVYYRAESLCDEMDGGYIPKTKSEKL